MSIVRKNSLLGLFVLSTLIGVVVGVVGLRLEKSRSFENALSAVGAMRGFQGIVLDTAGLGGLLVGLSEKTGDLFVRQIELRRAGGQPYVREFAMGGTLGFVDMLFSRLSVSSQLEDYEVKAVLLISTRAFVVVFLLASVAAFLFTSGVGISFDLRRRREELLVARKTHELALQVSHDIRSPVAALSAVVAQLAQIPEEQRFMIRSAVNRITDIANGLLAKNRNKAMVEQSDLSVQLVSGVVDSIVSEKRSQFQDRIGISIEAVLEKEAYGLFASINVIEFKRVLSNLINNAVEAIQDRGRVRVELRGDQRDLVIQIRDNGKGIPSEILPTLTERGATHGKAHGSGLGLYHARLAIESCGGSLEVQSTPGCGTTVTIRLRREPAPKWFCEELQVPQGSKVVVLDDDPSIHEVWNSRFECGTSGNCKIEMIHYASPDLMKNWFVAIGAPRAAGTLYLVDYELLGASQTGLDLVEALGLQRWSTLVSSHFDESAVRERCERLGVKMIPKCMAAFVPVKIREPKQKYDAILIDDDDLVHGAWKMIANQSGKKLKCYFSPEALLDDARVLDLDCPIFIDSNLGNGVKGEDWVPRLGELAFSKIYLATGYESDRFKHVTGLAGVVGKEPPVQLMSENY